jgi:predicted small secreted protein
MKKLLSLALASLLTAGCTATGGFTTDVDEMDVGNTIGLAIGAAITAYAIDQAGSGGSSCPYAPALWDYQPGNSSWVCRRTDNGQYTYDCNCSGQAYVDNWP